MTAFDIIINKRKRCRAGINKAGVVVSAITWVRGVKDVSRTPSGEDLELRVGGLISQTGIHVDWLHTKLKVGDEVTIRVVDQKKVDRPKKKRRESKATREKREKEYIQQRAARYGWRLVEGA